MHLGHAALTVVVLQVVHDVAFAVAFTAVPRDAYILDVFKDYAAEVGVHAICPALSWFLGVSSGRHPLTRTRTSS